MLRALPYGRAAGQPLVVRLAWALHMQNVKSMA